MIKVIKKSERSATIETENKTVSTSVKTQSKASSNWFNESIRNIKSEKAATLQLRVAIFGR